MGHTHHSYIRQFNCNGEKWAKQAINCGSVGRLKEGQPFATYLVLEIDSQQVKAEIIKLKYPVDQTIESIRNSEIPNFYADFLL
ncbi:MAG: metallophosphatase family protein [Segetibacter sp.]|nr:metallophosphatase family protein [Segetibacter sp.]